MENRPLCACGKQRAINYTRNGKTYYRKTCYACSKTPHLEAWERTGYKKQNVCEKCGFKSKYPEQMKVIQTKDVLHRYKSVCLNCEVEVSKTGWKVSALVPDF